MIGGVTVLLRKFVIAKPAAELTDTFDELNAEMKTENKFKQKAAQGRLALRCFFLLSY